MEIINAFIILEVVVLVLVTIRKRKQRILVELGDRKKSLDKEIRRIMLREQIISFVMMIACGGLGIAALIWGIFLLFGGSEVAQISGIIRVGAAIGNGAIARFYYGIWRDCNSQLGA